MKKKLKEVMVLIWLNEEEINKAMDVKQAMLRRDPERFKDYELPDILRDAIQRELPGALDGLKEFHELMARYEKK